MNHIPQILIGAATSGSGKTTFTVGLLRLLRKRGMAVQPFKCGPDYIDTRYHCLASGCESVNLDLRMADERHVASLYAHYSVGATATVTEGVMGLFDGYDRMKGSSAEVASLLNLPVILVLNARSMAYGVAPLLYGYRHYCSNLRVVGVVFNQIGSLRHLELLKQACEDAGLPCLGYLPRLKELEVPSRHLGLTLDVTEQFDAFAETVAQAIEEYVDVERLLQLCTQPIPCGQPIDSPHRTKALRIGVARDEAFNFVYREHLDGLQRLGEVVFFSPLRDASLPSDCDLLYLPGGYPEFFLEALEANESMREQLRHYIENNGRVWAECGGMMYLCQYIKGMDGELKRMVGILPTTATMEGMKLHLGYRSFELNGQRWNGHEFHYSRLESPCAELAVTMAQDSGGRPTDTAIYRYKNLFAGYTHLYWGNRDFTTLWTDL